MKVSETARTGRLMIISAASLLAFGATPSMVHAQQPQADPGGNAGGQFGGGRGGGFGGGFQGGRFGMMGQQANLTLASVPVAILTPALNLSQDQQTRIRTIQRTFDQRRQETMRSFSGFGSGQQRGGFGNGGNNGTNGGGAAGGQNGQGGNGEAPPGIGGQAGQGGNSGNEEAPPGIGGQGGNEEASPGNAGPGGNGGGAGEQAGGSGQGGAPGAGGFGGGQGGQGGFDPSVMQQRMQQRRQAMEQLQTAEASAAREIEAILTDEQKAAVAPAMREWNIVRQMGLPLEIASQLRLTEEQKTLLERQFGTRNRNLGRPGGGQGNPQPGGGAGVGNGGI